MVGAHDRSVDQSQVVSPRSGGPLIDTRSLLNALLVVIAICAISTVIAATAMGLTTVALVTALVAGAFFCGMLC